MFLAIWQLVVICVLAVGAGVIGGIWIVAFSEVKSPEEMIAEEQRKGFRRMRAHYNKANQ